MTPRTPYPRFERAEPGNLVYRLGPRPSDIMGYIERGTSDDGRRCFTVFLRGDDHESESHGEFLSLTMAKRYVSHTLGGR